MKKKLTLYFWIAAIVAVALGGGCKNGKAIAVIGGTSITDTNDWPSVILETLLNQFTQEKSITVAPQEIEKIQEKSLRTLDLLIAHETKQLDELIVANNGTAESSDEALKLKMQIKVLTSRRNNPDALEQTRLFAEQLVLRWKINKALYDMYGGDVVLYTIGGPEPNGAYISFLEEKESEGAFIIFDEQLRSHFWSEHTKYRTKKNLLLGDDDSFETPPWEVIIED